MKSAKVELEIELRKHRITIFKFTIVIILSLSIPSSIPNFCPPIHAEAVTGTIFVGMNPDSIGVNTSTNKIYVSSLGSNGTLPGNVTVIDGNTHSVLTIVTVGLSPAGLGVNSVTNRIYVANYNASTISVISGSTDSVMATITVGAHPSQVGVNVATNEVYVSNSGDNTLSVINGTSNTVLNTIPVGRHPGGIGVLTLTHEIYVANALDNTVSVINSQTNNVVATIPVGNGPSNIGADPTTNMIYVVDGNSYNGNVTVINGSSNTVAGSIPVGPFPTGIGVNPGTGKIYVANSPDILNLVDGTISVIDEFTGGIVNTVCLSSQAGCLSAHGGIYPAAIGVNVVTNEIYVAKASSKTVFVLSGHPTTTGVACNPSSIRVSMKTTCTTTVTDTSNSGPAAPTGTVFFSTSGTGSFNSTSCNLSGTAITLSCSVSYTPGTVGTGSHTIFATYGGDNKHMSSSGNTAVNVSDQTVGGTVIPIDKLALVVQFAVEGLLFLSGICALVLLERLSKKKLSGRGPKIE
ncbi:MAG TPA: hypothetical protein VNW25_06610 [Candidatus Sulfotelmatobacter sp.]|nr:hypothetical protein [Candidatus Sulfotelmatobacter sp.]